MNNKTTHVYAIADLHLDHTGNKSMEVFGCLWEKYEERIFDNWHQDIHENDLVLLPGDLSWALTLDEATEDLARIDALPGTKLLLRGNHDYWWQSRTKIEQLGFHSIHLLQNDCFVYHDVAIYGTRGWMNADSANFTEHDEKIYQRELKRLELSLEHASDTSTRIAILHYPPFNAKGEFNDFWHKLVDAKIDICVYGHLHGYGHALIREGHFDGIELHCVSADYLSFFPKKLL